MPSEPLHRCAAVFGFVAPPSPAIFMIDAPKTPWMREAIALFEKTGKMRPPPGIRVLADTLEYVQRTTVRVHELRHSHDLLGTTIGNHLVFSSIALGLQAYRQLRDRVRAGEPDILSPFIGAVNVLPTCPGFDELFGRNRTLMEGSAVMCQLAEAAIHLNEHAATSLILDYLDEDAAPAPRPYDAFLRALAALVDRLGGTSSQSLNDVARLLLSALCEEPSSEVDGKHLLAEMGAWGSLPRHAAAREVHDAANSRWKSARRSLAGAESTLRPWRTLMDQELFYLGRGETSGPDAILATTVRAAISDFDTHAQEMRGALLDDSDSYTDLQRYLRSRENMVRPLQCVLVAGQPPRVVEPPADARCMDLALWERFTFDFAPATYLVRPPDDSVEQDLFSSWLARQGIDRFRGCRA